ncbi:hypothetical protein GW933_02510 [Candidatus Falkowbacteria bacterium]|uniref:Pilus assembly protein PilO n=1 Tax=Candidatus Buchananbacteria bacterium CG10_big_fil_rev_8_21_14_0_10_33_19 TaxID=1974525 RepID=A0A2H0W4E4_9BACT|nr:hypothetical protein [Candidatus Falkowbacteria bacterium]PIS06184.1 MAG: hypothetical protein COT80_01265 [Candidatus Buchananbacteria bacterium CG10_big_fil_rev_8_21_14_0_10_33_19]
MVLSYYKNRFYINIGVILLFFTFITAFIIFPALKEISAVNQEITNERIKLERKLALGLNIKKVIKDLDNIEETAKTLDDIFLEKNSELNIINNLESLANQHNTNIDITSDFVKKDIGPNTNAMELKIIATGSYKQILNFISGIENQKNYFNLQNISFTKNKKSDGSSTVVAQLIGNVYFKK